MPQLLDRIVKFRNGIRTQAIVSSSQEVVQQCDAFRENLCDLGVRVTDSGNESKWSFEDKDVLLKEKEDKERTAAQREERRKKDNASKEQKEREKSEKSQVSPQNLFRTAE